LFALATVHARTREFPRVTLWTTRIIVIGTIPVSLVAIGEAWWEMSNLPFTRPGNAFGTYWEPTGLMVLGVGIMGALYLLAAALAWGRPRAAVLVYVLVGLWGIADAVQVLLTSSRPVENTVFGVVVGAIPALALAALLLSIRASLFGKRP
jgi:hypothetical protein